MTVSLVVILAFTWRVQNGAQPAAQAYIGKLRLLAPGANQNTATPTGGGQSENSDPPSHLLLLQPHSLQIAGFTRVSERK